MSMIDGELFRKKFFALDIEFRPSQIDAVFDCLGDSEIVESSVSCENASEITRKSNASGDLISREDALRFTNPEDWDTPDERWRAESEYGRYIQSLPSAERVGIPIEWLEEKLTNHPELPYAVTDGIIAVLELWNNECGARMVSEDE